MKIKKILLSALIISAMLYTIPIAAQASADNNSPDMESILTPEETDTLGSIEITLEKTKDNLPRKGVKLAFAKVANVTDGLFVLNETFKDTNVDLNNIKTANDLENAAKTLVKKNKADFTLTTDENGCVKAENIAVGVYLIFPMDIAGYENITPFLISIPTYNETDKQMDYDIKVLPKHTPLPKPDKPSVPNTGIENNALEFGALAVICLVLAGAVLIITKDKKKVQ